MLDVIGCHLKLIFVPFATALTRQLLVPKGCPLSLVQRVMVPVRSDELAMPAQQHSSALSLELIVLLPNL